MSADSYSPGVPPIPEGQEALQCYGRPSDARVAVDLALVTAFLIAAILAAVSAVGGEIVDAAGRMLAL